MDNIEVTYMRALENLNSSELSDKIKSLWREQIIYELESYRKGRRILRWSAGLIFAIVGLNLAHIFLK